MEERSRFRGAFNRGTSHRAAAAAAHTGQSATAAQPQTQPHTATHHPKPKKVGFFFGRKWLLLVIAGLVVLIGVLTFFYVDTRNQLNAAKNPAAAGSSETERIVAQINKTLLLPTGETPTLATVNDVSKLKNQVFFKNAQNGDKVLIFSKAGRAVLYRPSTKQVIEYAPVNLDANQ